MVAPRSRRGRVRHHRDRRRPPARSRASAARARAASPAPTRRAATCAAAPARCARCAVRSSVRSSPRRRASRAARPGSRIPSPCTRMPGRRSRPGVAVDRRRGPGRRRRRPAAPALRDAVRRHRAAASPATSTSPCASRPTRRSSARARTCCTCATIAFTQAALGTHLDVDTLEGLEELIVPPGTQPGHVFRLKGRGVPGAARPRAAATSSCASTSRSRTRLSAEEDELVRSFAGLRGEEVAAPQDKGVFSRLKSAFQ